MTRVSLQELLDLSDSGVWGDEDAENGISVLRSTNFNADGTVDFSNLSFRVIEDRKRESKLLREGDILLEKSGGGPKQPVGRVCLFRGHDLPHSFGNFIARLRPKSNVLSEFLFYFLWHFHATGRTSHYQKQTTGIRNLEYKRFLTIEVPVPPIPEQHRIVDLLSRAEGIVRLRREAEKKAAELIPALFLDMFGDPATNPKGWPGSTLEKVAEIQGGLQLTKARAALPLERPYLRVANAHRSRLDLTEIKKMRVSPAEFDRTKLYAGDLLVVEGHGNPREIGRVAAWDGSIPDCVHQNHLIRVRCVREVLDPTYVCEFLNSGSGRQSLLRSGKTTSGLNTISVGNVKVASILVPPLRLQQAFAVQVEDVRSIQSQQSSAAAKAKAAFDALLATTFAS